MEMHLSPLQIPVGQDPARWLVTLAQWRAWRGVYDRLPVVGAWENESLPGQWTAAWRGTRVSVLLETGKQGRYTIVANRIRTQMRGGCDEGTILGPNGLRVAQRMAGRPLNVLARWLSERRAPVVSEAPPFYGGLIGYLAYDVSETVESLRVPDRPDAPYPWYVWVEVDEGWVFDHDTRTLFCFSLCPADAIGPDVGALEAAFVRRRERIRRLRVEWRRWGMEAVREPPPDRPVALPADYFSSPRMELSLDRAAYATAVRAAQERIAAGETYQVNLSLRQTRRMAVPPERIYEALRRLNPSPYMALLRFPAQAIVSGSPELLFSVEAGRIEAHPIAATRPRGDTPAADAALAAEMLASPKERAEHLMLVDLLRNDIGRVAAYGSVRVREFMAIEHYSHVMHLVSRVEGRLAADRDLCAVIGALFPGGTITGAPKVRTMEIIAALEPGRRGVYSGAIGWIGYNATAKLNIAIRTLVAVDGMLCVQTGAGIVADSDPEREFAESLHKARALWLAVERAIREGGDEG